MENQSESNRDDVRGRPVPAGWLRSRRMFAVWDPRRIVFHLCVRFRRIIPIFLSVSRCFWLFEWNWIAPLPGNETVEAETAFPQHFDPQKSAVVICIIDSIQHRPPARADFQQSSFFKNGEKWILGQGNSCFAPIVGRWFHSVWN